MRFPTFQHELEYLEQGYNFVVGCDEVGRGPLAGPVVAAACVLDPVKIGKGRDKNDWHYRVRDSKTINEKEREVLEKKILENSLAYGVGVVSQEEIDALNIHHATLLAMRLAIENLLEKISTQVSKKILILVDGKFKIPDIAFEQQSIVSGDAQILSISAASILAKVHRDNIMRDMDAKFPDYGFARHKGYGTKEHLGAIGKLGITPIHRKSFCKLFLRDFKPPFSHVKIGAAPRSL